MATFVLVPGAWFGAWAWEDTARELEERGHTALPVTLTGLGERADLAGPETDLNTHIDDITAFVEQHGLREVSLVAHSYGGAPVTGAAARLGSRLERVVYVDSAPFAEGMSMLDLLPPEAADQLRKQVAESGEGWRFTMPPFDVLALSASLDGLGEEERERMRTHAAPQPFGTYEQKLTGPTDPGPGVDRVLVACNDFRTLLASGAPLLAPLTRPPWQRFELSTGHWPMISTPAALAAVLDEAAS